MLSIGMQIANGLNRKSVVTPSRWAESYRMMGMPFPGLFTFDHHPWSKAPHDCDAPEIVIQKAAQMGFTEVGLNKTFFNLDVLGNSVLYILPASKPDAADFANSRFDPALESSEHLRAMFTDTKNIGHKRAGHASLFIRGSRSKSQLKSVPVSLIVMDEIDEFVQKHIALAEERVSGQKTHQIMKISTPTTAGVGINLAFRNSTMEHFFFKCPHCGKLTELLFPECIEIATEDFTNIKIKDTFYKCKECNGRLEHEEKVHWMKDGIWVPQKPDRMSVGYHVNQMYSMVLEPWQLATLYLKSLTNPAAEQEFYNSKLGLVHEVSGARVSTEDIDNCTRQFSMTETVSPSALVTMGIDVGTKLHYEIISWKITNKSRDINTAATGTILKVGALSNFEEIDIKLRQYDVNAAVIDANPERRKSLELVRRYPGVVHACFYVRGQSGSDINIQKETVSVNRASWLNVALNRFKAQTINLPLDLPLDYKNHVKALVHVYKEDANGVPMGKYNNDGDDHFGHARCYSEIALRLINLNKNKDIVV